MQVILTYFQNERDTERKQENTLSCQKGLFCENNSSQIIAFFQQGQARELLLFFKEAPGKLGGTF